MNSTPNLKPPKPGTYVLAVSGGVDSVVLMHLLASKREAAGCKLEVAYIDHGWRDGSAEREKYLALFRRLMARTDLSERIP